jgi:hypothetical protein
MFVQSSWSAAWVMGLEAVGSEDGSAQIDRLILPFRAHLVPIGGLTRIRSTGRNDLPPARVATNRLIRCCSAVSSRAERFVPLRAWSASIVFPF